MQELMSILVKTGVLSSLVTLTWAFIGAALPFRINHKLLYWPLRFSMIFLTTVILTAIGLTMFGVIK